ncbi:class I SAM-dependent methyltransferase [Chitinophaga sp. HK235]|uniref:class I SAM-dependent methyltransferase n=1 Tax=Chitinophaga sp. HK235 TaxID=2952571 RepID=UPI001BA56ADB|nr:class I SAM-dependent methyltransferase [Chitinophaga sp. HK235]
MLIDFLIRNYIVFANRRLRVEPYPLTFWWQKRERLKRYSGKQNILTPSYRSLKTPGETIPVPELKGLYDGVTLGFWTLDAASMTLLWERLVKEKPRVIAECGCGVSTIMFAKYFSLHRPDGVLLSFEQDEKEKQRLDNRLKELGLEKGVHIYYVPVSDPDKGYDFHLKGGPSALPGIEPFDWLVVDGPNGSDNSRYTTVPALQELAKPGAVFFLDDSFRDGEFRILENWSKLPGVTVEGIYPIGKGLATGKFK